MSRQTESAQFNGVQLGDQVSIQIGANSEPLSISTGDPSQLISTINSLDISSQSSAQSAIDLIGEAAS